MEASSPCKVLVLGSTGSIGQQTLDVVRKHSDRLKVVGLAAGRRAGDLLAQAREFDAALVSLGCDEMRNSSDGSALAELGARFVGFGEESVLSLIDECGADVVVNSLVGAQGVRASYRTLELGIDLALANKESLVVAGDLLMPMAKAADSGYATFDHGGTFEPRGALRPIDSEHGAIFQCLLGERLSEVDRLWVTASGGPFRGKRAFELEGMTAADALAHPTWNMGPKITIDSSTLMNKGLEVIEAHHLFGMPYDRIEVVVQPQSAIHSMVEFADGSVKAHLGTTDMRIPIQFALSYPERWESPVKRMDFRELGSLEFAAPDMETFRCLALAMQAGSEGGTLPCAMNAANEVAVDAFLHGRCGYLDIPRAVESVMLSHSKQDVDSVEQLVEVDGLARSEARRVLGLR